MTQVTFYLLEQTDQEHPAHWLVACQLAASHFRSRRRVLVLCQDKSSAEAFDNLLWQQPLDGFVPHNLTGEGPANGAPVEICWQLPQLLNRPILINLADEMPQQCQRFQQIIDFVPSEDKAKQQARERYKQYRTAGFNLATEAASSINEKHHG